MAGSATPKQSTGFDVETDDVKKAAGMVGDLAGRSRQLAVDLVNSVSGLPADAFGTLTSSGPLLEQVIRRVRAGGSSLNKTATDLDAVEQALHENRLSYLDGDQTATAAYAQVARSTDAVG